jgi:RNA methyltransferase, TrmH family
MSPKPPRDKFADKSRDIAAENPWGKRESFSPRKSGSDEYRQDRDRPQRSRDEYTDAPRSRQHDRRSEYAQTESAEERAPRIKEQRLYGINACMAMFVKRPQDLRKAYLLESRIPHLQPVLAHCVQNRLGYRVVEEEDLDKLTQTTHHEGLCFDVIPREELSLSTWLQNLPAGPRVAIWLDGVGNPHNFGAILRSAAHFGAAVFLPKYDPLALSGAAARVAEGGAEMVDLVRLGRSDNAAAQLRSAGFELAATVVRDGESVFKTKLPERLVLVMGAEQTGVDPSMLQSIQKRLLIPGTGDVESLNVSAATAVFLSHWAARL